jgi:drug/metabolite transporter (DMT)-like permease
MLIIPIIFKNGFVLSQSIFKTQRVGLHIWRSIFSLCISFSLFYAVQYMPLVNAMLLANTVPFIVPFLAFFFLSQKINHRLWVPLMVGFIGVGMVLHPDAHSFNAASLLALIAAVMMGASLLVVRQISRTESTETTILYFFIFSTLISGILSIPFWTPLQDHALWIMILIGVLYFLTQYGFTAALRFVEAQLVGSLMYANIVYSALISIFFWGVYPNWQTYCGMLFIIVGGIYCIHVANQKPQTEHP